MYLQTMASVDELRGITQKEVARSSASPPTNINVSAKVVSIQDASTCDLVIIRNGVFERFQCHLLEVNKAQLQDRSLNALKCRDFFVWLCCGNLVRNFRTWTQPLNEDQVQDTLDYNRRLIHAEFSVLDDTGRPLVTLKRYPKSYTTFNTRFIEFDYEEHLSCELKYVTGKEVVTFSVSPPKNIYVRAKVLSIYDACTCDLAILRNACYQRIQCRLLEVDKQNLTDGSLNALKCRDFFAWLCCHHHPRNFPNAAPPLNEDQLQGMLDHSQRLVHARFLSALDNPDRSLVILKPSSISTTTFNDRLMEFNHEENMTSYLQHVRGGVIPRSLAFPPTNINVCAKIVGVHDPFTCDLVILRNGTLERFLCRLQGLDQPKMHLQDDVRRALRYRDFFAWWCSGVSHPSNFPPFDPPWDECNRQGVLDNNMNLVYAEFSGVGAFGEPLIILRRNPEDSATKTLNAVLVEYGYT